MFCDYDSKYKRIEKVDIKAWQSIAQINTLKSGTIYVWSYENKSVRDALYYIKNKKNIRILSTLGEVLSDVIIEELAELDMWDNFKNVKLVNVPSSAHNYSQRGYNPSEEIVKVVSTQTGIPHLRQALLKVKNTEPQKKLNRESRLRNMHKSIQANNKLQREIQNQNFVIIDDIVTTGATLAECKRALIKGGAKKVLCIALAH
jgi:ComF family protein